MIMHLDAGETWKVHIVDSNLRLTVRNSNFGCSGKAQRKLKTLKEFDAFQESSKNFLTKSLHSKSLPTKNLLSSSENFLVRTSY